MSFKVFLTLLIVGAIAGFVASLIMKRRGLGLPGNLIVGVGGAFLGRYLLGLIGISVAQPNSLGFLLSAIGGALLLLWLLSFIKK